MAKAKSQSRERVEPMSEFFSPYSHQFARVATCVPQVAVADPVRNGEQVAALVERGDRDGVAVMLFPELCLSAYAIDDLLFQDALLDAVEGQLGRLVELSRERRPVIVVGAPLRWRGRLYNCAIVIHRGRVLGIVPKTYLPNYREFYERRHFTSGEAIRGQAMTLAGQEAPFGIDLLFDATGSTPFTFHIEICEDLWVPQPPSIAGAAAGAEILLNLSASNITIGKAQMRRLLCASQSARCIAAYAYSAAGAGKLTTDLAWDGQAGIFEMGEGLGETERFSATSEMAIADIDLGRIRQERMRTNSFGDNAPSWSAPTPALRRVEFAFAAPEGRLDLRRRIERFPFVPSDPAMLRENCYEAYNIQVQGLAQRLQATGLKKLVIGVSGGLDFDPGADRHLSHDGPARPAAKERAGVHAAGLCHERRNQVECLAIDKGARRHRRRDRYTSGGQPDVGRYRPCGGARRKALRCDVRERAGRFAYRLSVPPRQPQRCAGRRHRRFVRAGAWLVHLWRRRSHVALQSQRLGIEDADPAFDPLCRA